MPRRRTPCGPRSELHTAQQANDTACRRKTPAGSPAQGSDNPAGRAGSRGDGRCQRRSGRRSHAENADAQQTVRADETESPLPALEAKLTALQAQRTRLAETEKALTARLVPNRKALAEYRTHAAQLAQLDQRWQWVSALAATAGGTLSSKQKIRLEASIQMQYLDRILIHANTRLMQMTAGQYELERIGAENQKSQSGAGPGVIDHYNGTRRSVKTLSGGESFKGSLALALAFRTRYRARPHGIRLDTLFLDEGFGSLDELAGTGHPGAGGLTEGDRLVGIISHVGAPQGAHRPSGGGKKARTGGSTVELVV